MGKFFYMPGNPGLAARIESKRWLPSLPPSGDEWLNTFQNHPRFEKLVSPASELSSMMEYPSRATSKETPGFSPGRRSLDITRTQIKDSPIFDGRQKWDCKTKKSNSDFSSYATIVVWELKYFYDVIREIFFPIAKFTPLENRF